MLIPLNTAVATTHADNNTSADYTTSNPDTMNKYVTIKNTDIGCECGSKLNAW